jgi:AcrR family transcriptional regulator
MARRARPRRSSGSKAARGQRARRAPSGTPKDRVIDAAMALFATRDFAKVGLADIAEEAGVSLSALRELYDGKLAIVADFSRRIDQAVLEGGPAEGETPRDRLFEILMRRFDALGPHKAAVRSLARAARRDLCLGRFLHKNSRRSQSWMLVAAGADVSGLLRAVAVEGLVCVHAEALRTWLHDDDPGLAKTMATLDRALERGARAMNFVHDVCERFRPFVSRDRATRRGAAARG